MAKWPGTVVGVADFHAWYADLDEPLQDRMLALLEELRERGPLMGLEGSKRVIGKHPFDVWELRIKTPPLRVLYTFDPQRNAVLLLGGNKQDEWNAWYPGAIKRAHKIYQTYLASQSRRNGA